MNYKVNKLESISLIVIIIANQIILNLSNTLLKETGTGAFLNVIYISIISLFFCLLICKLFKPFTSHDILDISEYLGGKLLKIIIGILYIGFFLIITATLTEHFSHSLNLIYFSNIPIEFIFLLFLIPPVVVNRLGLKSISGVSLFAVMILLISTFIIGISVYKNLSIQNLFPLLGHGINKTFLLGIGNIAIFSTIGYLYFLPSLLKEPNDFKSISVTSVVISAIYLILTSVFLLMVFPYITDSKEMLASYLITRIIRYGDFLQRVDAIFIFIWILSTLAYISVNFFYILTIFKKLTKIKKESELSLNIAIITFSLCLIIRHVFDIEFLEKYVYKYSVLILIFGVSFLILLLAYLKKTYKRIGS